MLFEQRAVEGVIGLKGMLWGQVCAGPGVGPCGKLGSLEWVAQQAHNCLGELVVGL